MEVVSVSTGVINRLLGKLSMLIMEKAERLARVQQAVLSLREEFGSMHALILYASWGEVPDVQVKEWMRQVREVAYDTEDCIDLYLHDELRREAYFLGWLSPKARSKPEMLLEQMKQLKERLVHASERRTRYNLIGPPASDANTTADDLGSSSVALDPRLLHMEEATPVAIGRPKNSVLELLMNNKRHLKVVSIVGMAGIGKTTLAKQVYRTVLMQRQFKCQAFVYVGRSPSIRTVLMDILRQVSPQEQQRMLGEHEAMTKLRKFLADKRYLIIFDDIWSMSAWKAINCALPGNDTGSRIITTIRVHDVAKACSSHPDDVIYMMETLDISDSKRLFHSRIFGSEEEKCPKECSEVHDNEWKICSGLPWAILVVASLLARKYEELGGWNMVTRSTLSQLEQYPPLQGMSKILHMSYADLPVPMKSCLLYLSVFPENCTINKDRLIWRWIAEGFIPRISKESPLETGRSYFNELVNRSLIQLVFSDDYEDDPIGCTVHGAVHEFVVSLSSEENFVTSDEELMSMPRDVIRRLSLNYAKQDDGTLESDSGSINYLSKTRSLTVFGCAQRMPHLANFLLLQVLDLEDAEGLRNKNIKYIGKLFNLRYLGLGGEHVTELPASVGQLQLLETIEVRRTNIRKLPPTVVRLQKLARLLAKALDNIPTGIEKMLDLQELSMINVNNHRSIKSVAELVKLRQLRILGLKWCFRDGLSSLNRITESNLEYLFLHSDDACSLDFLVDSWIPPVLLQKLVMKSPNYHFRRIPEKLDSCPNLTYLDIAVNLDREGDLSIIASLPALITLKLSAKEKGIIITGQGFQCLKVFWFECGGGDFKLVFGEGAMPQLRKLHLSFKLVTLQQPQGSFDFGLQNLLSLKQVRAKINCDGAGVSEVNHVENAINKVLSMHRNKPTLELSKDNYDEGQKSTVEEANN